MFKKIKANSELQAMVSNIGWLALQKFLTVGLNFIVVIMVIRYLGPKNLGVLTYAQALVAIFSSLVSLGLGQIVIQALVKASEKKTQLILGSSFILMLIGASISVLLLMSLAIFTENSFQEKMAILIISFSCFFQCFNSIDYYFQSKIKSRYFVFAQIAQSILSVLLRLGLLYFKASLLAFAFAYLFDAVVLGLNLIFVYYWRVGNLLKWRASTDAMFFLLGRSWPLMFSGLAVAVYMQVDQVMLKWLMGPSAVGLYGAAVKITGFWYFVPSIIGQTLFPVLIRAYKETPIFFYQKMRLYFFFSIWFPLLVALLFSFLAPWIIQFLYGASYKSSAVVLAVSMWGAVFVFIGVASTNYLLIKGRQKIIMITTVIGALLNIGFNIFLIPTLGLLGAALSTFLAYALVNYFVLFLFKDSRDSFWLISRSFLPIGIFKNGKI